ncbi:MAG: galactokinase [Planctomycetes bacterium]|nr:galactokinase [Planctomycetota bacterium]
MIICRAPLRVTLGGGGTDLPSFYRHHGCDMVTASLGSYVYITVNPRRLSEDFWISYSRVEHVEDLGSLQHELVREALRGLGVPPGVEVHSISEIPSGTGLGSSGSFTVCLLLALHRFLGQGTAPAGLAEEAYHIEREVLGKPVGKQDPYIAAHGGVQRLRIRADGEARCEPLALASQDLRELNHRLLFFYTGRRRNAEVVLAEQDRAAPPTVDALMTIRELGLEIAHALEAGDLRRFGELTHEHWEAKRRISDRVSDAWIDEVYAAGRGHGALGGKLMGAGGGGFLMFYVEGDPGELRAAMREAGLVELHTRVGVRGATTLAELDD